jgi:hypothetical protein
MIVDEMRSHSVILEDMRSQNRATIEAVEASRLALEQRIDRLDQETRARDATLEFAIRSLTVNVQQNTVDIQQNTVNIQQNTLDIRDLSAKVETLARLEECRLGDLRPQAIQAALCRVIAA